jgi:hypothetical protein
MAKKKTVKKTVNKRKTTKTAKQSFNLSKLKVDNQSLMLLAIALIVVVIAALFVARLTRGKTDSEGAMDQTGKSESGITVPKGVAQCPKNFYEKTGNTYKVDANKQPKTEICQYYRTVKAGRESIHNLQYNNEVVACRFFKENGETMIGETKYIHLGYEKKACSQGMYKKN